MDEMERIETITIEQLMARLQIGRTKAYEIMAGIKSVSDTLGISGMCHEQDYQAWLRSRLGKTKKIFKKECGV